MCSSARWCIAALPACQDSLCSPEHLPAKCQLWLLAADSGPAGQLSKTAGLSRALVSGGVHATARFDLPSPAKAVRNLVRCCTLVLLSHGLRLHSCLTGSCTCR